MDLHTENQNDLDISGSGAKVLTYTYPGPEPKSVLCRVTAGSVGSPIAGGSTYIVRARVGGIWVSPDSLVTVQAGVTQTLLQSREIMLRAADLLEVFLIGAVADISVDTVAILTDYTPLTEQDVFGTGPSPVDHNYGGTDNFRVLTSLGASVADARITVFLKSEYDAGNRSSAFVRGRSITLSDGRWQQPIMLEPGTYTMVISKQGAITPKVVTLVVT